MSNVLNNPFDMKQLKHNRTAYWHQDSGTIVIRNPKAIDGGTVFQPTHGYEFFLKRIK